MVINKTCALDEKVDLPLLVAIIIGNYWVDKIIL
jgi:hypothetical protein